jgi:hypothetical protein
LFGIAVVVAVQSVFLLEKHGNEIFFYFLKIIFYISTSKRYENIKKIKIFENAVCTTFQTHPK